MYCPQCGDGVEGIVGEDDDCHYCGVWWHQDCFDEWKQEHGGWWDD